MYITYFYTLYTVHKYKYICYPPSFLWYGINISIIHIEIFFYYYSEAWEPFFSIVFFQLLHFIWFLKKEIKVAKSMLLNISCICICSYIQSIHKWTIQYTYKLNEASLYFVLNELQHCIWYHFLLCKNDHT